ncbi:hypothetical protein F5887DRAFT_1073391 [Amanita rubescens]|nr:hypothetical protein F5887DRAFT_1073391 [Amanita rubescens]
MGKTTALHTHFNHPQEITWVTEVAARKLFEQGITVRNQTVLLKGPTITYSVYLGEEVLNQENLLVSLYDERWALSVNASRRKKGGNGANLRAPKRVEEETLNEMTIIATSRKESKASFANDLETAGSKHKNRVAPEDDIVGNDAVLLLKLRNKEEQTPVKRPRVPISEKFTPDLQLHPSQASQANTALLSGR